MFNFKTFVMCLSLCGVILMSSAKGSAAENISVSERARSAVESVQDAPFWQKMLNVLTFYWEKFVVWFTALPGVSHYLASDYTTTNYRKSMRKFSDEYQPHLASQNTGQLLRDGAQKLKEVDKNTRVMK